MLRLPRTCWFIDPVVVLETYEDRRNSTASGLPAALIWINAIRPFPAPRAALSPGLARRSMSPPNPVGTCSGIRQASPCFRHAPHVRIQRLDRICGTTVGGNAKWIGALGREQASPPGAAARRSQPLLRSNADLRVSSRLGSPGSLRTGLQYCECPRHHRRSAPMLARGPRLSQENRNIAATDRRHHPVASRGCRAGSAANASRSAAYFGSATSTPFSTMLPLGLCSPSCASGTFSDGFVADLACIPSQIGYMPCLKHVQFIQHLEFLTSEMAKWI